MQTARMTVLMTPERKRAIEANAAQLGVSSGEYARRVFDRAEQAPTPEEEAELFALMAELDVAVPRMRESLERTTAQLAAMHHEMDRFLTSKGF